MIKTPTKFQKSIIEQIEKIGDVIGLIEQLCKVIEKLDPILVDKSGGLSYSQPILDFIINHRKYTIWYNEMRDFIFQELTNGAYIIKNI